MHTVERSDATPGVCVSKLVFFKIGRLTRTIHGLLQRILLQYPHGYCGLVWRFVALKRQVPCFLPVARVLAENLRCSATCSKTAINPDFSSGAPAALFGVSALKHGYLYCRSTQIEVPIDDPDVDERGFLQMDFYRLGFGIVQGYF